MRWWLLPLFLAGCDRVFGLAERDGGTDVLTGESTGECVPGPFDEDLDGVLDGCDDCPTIADAPQADGDGDHVGDACDRHPTTPNDSIALYSGFTDLVGWEVAGTATVSGSSVTLASVATMTTSLPIEQPDRIEVSSLSLSEGQVQIAVLQGGSAVAGCTFARAGCAGEAGAVCVTPFASKSLTVALAPSSPMRLSIETSTDGFYACSVVQDPRRGTAVATAGALITGRLQLATSNPAQITIGSVIAYSTTL